MVNYSENSMQKKKKKVPKYASFVLRKCLIFGLKYGLGLSPIYNVFGSDDLFIVPFLSHELNLLFCVCVCVCVCINVAGLVAGLHSDDPVSARGLLHAGGLHSDDRVGQRKTPQLPEGVP